MGKLNSRIVAIMLLVVWCSMVCACNRGPKHRNLVINTADAGKIAYFILYVIISEYGKKLDKQYICPVYCEVDHIHRWRCYENKQAKEVYIQRADGLYGGTLQPYREQSESDLRSKSGVRIGCSDSDSLVGI